MKILSQHLFIPLLEKWNGCSTIKCLAELESSQWLSRGGLDQLQQQRLKALIRHAYQNVPYYRKVFDKLNLNPDDIKTREDLQKLPILTREIVRQNASELMAQNYPRDKMRLLSTGGTTGEPLRFYIPRDHGWSEAAFWRALGWYGCEIGDKWALIWSHRYQQTVAGNMQDRISQTLRRFIFLSAFELTEEQIGLFLHKMAEFQPKYLIAYPSAAHILAGYIRQHRTETLSLTTVITTAEKLYDYQREVIREAFGCDVFEYYGGGECNSIAYECPQHHGLHVTMENVIVEVVSDGKPVSPGGEGSILVTDLHNYAMPFIRYANGDLGVVSDRICPCGRALLLLQSVEGRITDVIVTKSGFVSSPIVTTVFKNLPVRQYQVVQESREKVVIKIVKGDGYSSRDTDYILGTLQRYLGKDMELDIEFVNSISPTKAGKRRVVISTLPVLR